MSETIYGDMWGEILFDENGNKQVIIFDGKTRYEPSLCLGSKLNIEMLIKFLKKAQTIEVR